MIADVVLCIGGWCVMAVTAAAMFSRLRRAERRAQARLDFDRHVSDALALHGAEDTWTDVRARADIRAWEKELHR